MSAASAVKIAVNPKDLPYLLVNLRTDSDHNNDVSTTKSTAGAISTIRGPHGTKAPIDWFSRKQLATGRHTAECETGAMDMGTFSLGLPLVGLMEELLGRSVRLFSEEDNTASLEAIAKGYSRKMAYLKKTSRVSLGALHEVYYGSEAVDLEGSDAQSINRLAHLSGSKMTADVFTKPVTHEVFWRLLKEAGLAAVPMIEYRRYRHDKEQRKKHKEEKKAAKQLRVEKAVAKKAGR